jgi:tetratricopeptide (TPR) repeat protein
VSGLFERERELAELDTMVRDAQAGRGCLAVVEAPAGLGKTRLLQVLRTTGQTAGMRVLAARATELERDFPFALVRQLSEPHLATLQASEREALFEGAADAARGALGYATATSSGGGAADAFAVLHGLYWLTTALAEQAPLLLAIDDAHWADAASLDFVGFLLPRVEELPVVLAVTCRPDEAGTGADSDLARIATDSHARRLTPRPLSAAAAAALLGAELGEQPDDLFAATCHEVSGGNPFLLHELARTVAVQAISPSAEHAPRVHELAPERVARTVLVRLARLSPAAQAVASALVVLGDDVDHRLAAALAGLDDATALGGADELRGAAIFDPAASSLRFAHPLVRTALHHEVPAGERARAHARAAELLRARGASAERRATHLVATTPCGDRATVETLVEAGAKALESGAPRSAIAYLTRALHEPAPADLRVDVLDSLLSACIRATDQSAYAAIEEDVLAELRRDPALQLRWGVELSSWLAISGRMQQAVELLEQAIETAARDDDVERAFSLEAQLTRLAQLPPHVARDRLGRYRDRIEPGSRTDRLAAAVEARWAVVHGTAAEAATLAQRALGDDARLLIEQPEAGAPSHTVMVMALAERHEAAARAARQAMTFARRRGAPHELAGAWSLSAYAALLRGDLTAAEADARQCVDIARLCGLVTVEPMLTPGLVVILVARGDLDAGAAELARTGMAEGSIPDNPWLMRLSLARGTLRYAQGRAREAADDLLELHERKQRWGIGGNVMIQAGAYGALALAACGEREQARALAEADLASARRWGAPTPQCLALCALGVASADGEGLALLQEATLQGATASTQAFALVELGAALRRMN